MNLDLANIKEVIQTNCHIADSQAASDYTLCIYLLKMREFFRWESSYDFGDALPGKEVGDWLRARESLWETLDSNDFARIPIDGQQFDPFDNAAINDVLKPQRLVYSGGLGRNAKPHFFLGVLERYEQHSDFEIIVVADEYARDLTAPPAMSQGKTIYIRREAMRRLIWEKYEQWLWNKPDNAMKRALDYYDFENNLQASLTDMTNQELDNAVLHEIGEVKVYDLLGTGWEEFLISVPHSKLEVQLRAIRDHLADCLSTLPTLIRDQNRASIHFYMGNLSHMRKDLFPALLKAYEDWLVNDNFNNLAQLVDQAGQHWLKLCETVLSHWQSRPSIDHQELVALIDQQRL